MDDFVKYSCALICALLVLRDLHKEKVFKNEKYLK